MLNFDRYTVKYGTHNIQNDCHQWFSGSFRVHQIRFRQRLRPGHTGGTYSSPDPLAGLRALFLRGGRMGGKGERERIRGEEEKGRDRPFCKFLESPLICYSHVYWAQKNFHMNDRIIIIALMFFIVIGALQVILTMIMVQKCGEIFLILINYLGHFLFQRLTVYCSYGHFLICLVFTLCSSEHFVWTKCNIIIIIDVFSWVFVDGSCCVYIHYRPVWC